MEGRRTDGLLLAVWLLTGLASQSLAPKASGWVLALLPMLQSLDSHLLHAVLQVPLDVPTCMPHSHPGFQCQWTSSAHRTAGICCSPACMLHSNPEPLQRHLAFHGAPADFLYICCAATLEHSPGTNVALFVTYLTPPLLERMHATEGAYNLCELHEVQLHLGLGLEEFR